MFAVTGDETVLAKARAAALWCYYASTSGDKPWPYMLVPHHAILDSMSLAGLAASYTFTELPPETAQKTA